MSKILFVFMLCRNVVMMIEVSMKMVVMIDLMRSNDGFMMRIFLNVYV